jgi:hypothetical protein
MVNSRSGRSRVKNPPHGSVGILQILFTSLPFSELTPTAKDSAARSILRSGAEFPFFFPCSEGLKNPHTAVWGIFCSQSFEE